MTTPDLPSEWPRIEAEREARIRADERARIVARIRRGAANPWAPAPDRHAWERLADLIEMEGHDGR